MHTVSPVSEGIPLPGAALFKELSVGCEMLSLNFASLSLGLQHSQIRASGKTIWNGCEVIDINQSDDRTDNSLNKLWKKFGYDASPDQGNQSQFVDESVLQNIADGTEIQEFPEVLPEEIEQPLQAQTREALTCSPKGSAVNI
jgi:hypothetical protein